MSQFDFGTIDPNSKSGAQLALDLNKFRDALNSGHRGSVRPSYAQAGMQWVRETSSTQWDLMFFDGDTDFAIRSINPTTNTLLQIPSSQIGGLGTAATANLTTSSTDTTAGRALRVADFGLGGSLAADTADPDALQFSCFFRAFNSAKMPTLATFSGIHVQRDTGNARASQVVWSDATNKAYTRTRGSLGAWSAWSEFYTTANVSAFMQTLMPAADAAAARATLGTSSLGVGQTWQAVNRVLGTVYTNSTGKEIVCQSTIVSGTSVPGYLQCSINGGPNISIVSAGGSTVPQCTASGSIIIPAGATYKYTTIQIVSIDFFELR